MPRLYHVVISAVRAKKAGKAADKQRQDENDDEDHQDDDVKSGDLEKAQPS
jgi:hypothetical protein